MADKPLRQKIKEFEAQGMALFTECEAAGFEFRHVTWGVVNFEQAIMWLEKEDKR